MRVIVFAQDNSGRNDHGHYTTDTIEEAVANYDFDDAGGRHCYADADLEHPLSKDDAIALLEAERILEFYNEEGELTRFTLEA